MGGGVCFQNFPSQILSHLAAFGLVVLELSDDFSMAGFSSLLASSLNDIPQERPGLHAILNH